MSTATQAVGTPPVVIQSVGRRPAGRDGRRLVTSNAAVAYPPHSLRGDGTRANRSHGHPTGTGRLTPPEVNK
jgi:hypothetical protein